LEGTTSTHFSSFFSSEFASSNHKFRTHELDIKYKFSP
jgi:hypothetical protein